MSTPTRETLAARLPLVAERLSLQAQWRFAARGNDDATAVQATRDAEDVRQAADALDALARVELGRGVWRCGVCKAIHTPDEQIADHLDAVIRRALALAPIGDDANPVPPAPSTGPREDA